VPIVQRAPEDKSLMNSDGLPPNRPQSSPSEERRSILDLFRN
jgi:penicillin-binding protein 1A